MDNKQKITEAMRIMAAFAADTGLTGKCKPVRYLWTDAFAVCNFLTIYRHTGDEDWLRLAISLIDQVHHVLGTFGDNDSRCGWISGLAQNEGEKHPLAGGLRIGKKLPERAPGEPFDEQLEWDRDGQYFHYLSKWMHALERAAVITGDEKYCRWAIELAMAAHRAFVVDGPAPGEKRMVWKMSIDLKRPLVASMGHHDPLDALVTYCELETCRATHFAGNRLPDLERQRTDAASMCEGRSWASPDPLGTGGLLFDAGRVVQINAAGLVTVPLEVAALLGDAITGLDAWAGQGQMRLDARFRLAFRELGLAIGLEAVALMNELSSGNGERFSSAMPGLLARLSNRSGAGREIIRFWQAPAHQQVDSWREHLEINRVMLATSLAPDDFLLI